MTSAIPPDIDARPTSSVTREMQHYSDPPIDAIRDYIARNNSGIGTLISGIFAIRTLDEAEKLSTMLAMHTPDPDRIAAGIWELLSNAIEHGNLEITFEEKSALLMAGKFADEIAQRLTRSPFNHRAVRVEFAREPGAIKVTIIDEGKGFDFSQFINREFSLNLPNGRGIPIASRFSFDDVRYFGRGNHVEAIVRV